MKFSAKIITSNSGEEKIEVIGEKDNTTRDEGYIIYNLEYRNTIGKTLLSMEPLNNYEFSDSELFTTSNQGKKIYTYPTYDMLAKGKIDYKELAYREDSINVNNDAGYFSFNFSADGILLKDKNTKVNLSYTSDNEI